MKKILLLLGLILIFSSCKTQRSGCSTFITYDDVYDKPIHHSNVNDYDTIAHTQSTTQITNVSYHYDVDDLYYTNNLNRWYNQIYYYPTYWYNNYWYNPYYYSYSYYTWNYWYIYNSYKYPQYNIWYVYSPYYYYYLYYYPYNYQYYSWSNTNSYGNYWYGHRTNGSNNSSYSTGTNKIGRAHV